MILATLAIKGYAGKSKINLATKVGIKHGTLATLVGHLMLHSHGFLTELTWQVLS